MIILSNIVSTETTLPTNKEQINKLLKNKQFTLKKENLLYKGKPFAKVYWSYESKGFGEIIFSSPSLTDVFLDAINA